MSGKNSFIQKDPIAEAVKEVMEASLKGNQKVLDKNKNGKLDSDDFRILRGEKKAKEDGMKESSNPFSPNYKSQMPSKPGEKAGFDSKKISTGTVYTKKHKAEPAEKESQKEDFSYFKDKLAEALMEERVVDELINEVLSKDASAGDWIHDFVHSDNPKFKGKSKAKRKEMALAAYYAKKRNEEVEQIDEGKMDKMSLSHLWHRHAQHSYGADQGYGGGMGGHHSEHAATAIENHVRKHYGNKVADDMCHHSDCHVAHAEYAGEKESKEIEKEAEKLRKKHGIKGDLYGHHESMKEEVEQIDEKNWIAGAVKKPGALHKQLKVPAGEKIPASKLAAAAKEGGKLGKRARLAMTLKNLPRHHGPRNEEFEQIEESKRPESDTVPFVTDESKPLQIGRAHV